MTYQEASDFLVSLAQNDYTIDGKMLPSGKILLDIASWLQSKSDILHGRYEVES